MKVIGYDPILTADAAARIGIELVSLDELFARSDFITVHTPLTDDTRGIVGRAAFEKMAISLFGHPAGAGEMCRLRHVPPMRERRMEVVAISQPGIIEQRYGFRDDTPARHGCNQDVIAIQGCAGEALTRMLPQGDADIVELHIEIRPLCRGNECAYHPPRRFRGNHMLAQS